MREEWNKQSESEINFSFPIVSYVQLSAMKRWTAFSNGRLNNSTTIIGLSSYLGRVSVGLSLMKQKFSGVQLDERLAVLNLSVPLQDNNSGSSGSHSFLNSSLYSDKSGKTNNSTVSVGIIPVLTGLRTVLA